MPTPSIHAFAEKVTLIINGGNGVGRAVALQLALQGAFVIVGFSGESEENKKITEQLKMLGTLAHAVEFDNPKTLVDEVDKIYGRIDLLVICVNAEGNDFVEKIIEEAKQLTESRPKISIVVCGAYEPLTELTEKLARNLPAKYRINCLIKKLSEKPKEFGLFTENNNDDAARVITFLLSSEAKALNGQVLYID